MKVKDVVRALLMGCDEFSRQRLETGPGDRGAHNTLEQSRGLRASRGKLIAEGRASFGRRGVSAVVAHRVAEALRRGEALQLRAGGRPVVAVPAAPGEAEHLVGAAVDLLVLDPSTGASGSGPVSAVESDPDCQSPTGSE